MKFNVGILIAIQAVGAFSSAVMRDAEAECSNLGGVMLLDNLPAEVDVGAVRQCVDGPSGSSETSELEKRECWYGKDVGCSKSGYCYKKCGEKNSGMLYEEMHIPPSPPNSYYPTLSIKTWPFVLMWTIKRHLVLDR